MNFDFSSIDSTVYYLKSFGVHGPLVTFILFFLQAIAPIIPYIIIAGAAGMIFGKWVGFLLAWLGALMGAWFLFWISGKIAGNKWLVKLQQHYNFNVDRIDGRHIFWVLLACRIFPVVPTFLINIGAALAGVNPKIFFFSSALGKLPWAFIYVALGDYLMKSKNISNTLTLIGLLLLVSFLGINFLRRRLPKYYS